MSLGCRGLHSPAPEDCFRAKRRLRPVRMNTSVNTYVKVSARKKTLGERYQRQKGLIWGQSCRKGQAASNDGNWLNSGRWFSISPRVSGSDKEKQMHPACQSQYFMRRS